MGTVTTEGKRDAMATTTAPLSIIRDDEAHAVAIAEFDDLVALDPQPGTAESDRLDLLILLIDEYESRRWPIEMPDPVSAIKFVMDQKGLKRRDLVPYLGDRFMVSRVLSGRRGLSLAQIRALHKGLGIPLEILIQPTALPSDTEMEPEPA